MYVKNTHHIVRKWFKACTPEFLYQCLMSINKKGLPEKLRAGSGFDTVIYCSE